MVEITIHSKKDGSTRIIIEGDIIAKLCRCGKSKTMPLCDSTHKEIGFRAEASEIKINVPDKPVATSDHNSKE